MSVKKILVFNVNWVGDVVLSSPVFMALKKHYAGAEVSCVAHSRVKDVLECIPGIDHIIEYAEGGQHKSILGKIHLIQQLRREKFDVCFLLHRSLTRAFLVYLAGIKERVGYAAKNRSSLLTHAVELPKKELHRCYHYLNIVESYGVPVKDKATVLSVPPQAAQEVDKMLAEAGIQQNDPFVVINPGGNWDLKRWPIDYVKELVRQLSEEKNFKVVVTGGGQDIQLHNQLKDVFSSRVVSLIGKTSLKQMIALLKRARLLICADSGPLHMASSVGTRAIGIFGPTRPELTKPLGAGEPVILQQDVGCNRKACYYLQCPENICMKAVSVYDVKKTAQHILSA